MTQQSIVWQDREVRFDLAETDLKNGWGEEEIDAMAQIEDSKSDDGQCGVLLITNLRTIWKSAKSYKPNLSIGHNTIAAIQIRTSKSKQRGVTQSLCLTAKTRVASHNKESRFEFIFASINEQSPRIFSTAQQVLRMYENTKLYRDLRLRVSIIRDHKLLVLPGNDEEIYSHQNGVWNLSADKGNLGSFYVTNVRLVWHATNAPTFNVSLPYLQICSARIQQSKFGQALVVETTNRAGGYVLGFRIDPPTQLEATLKEINSIRAVFARKPIFGISALNFKTDDALKKEKPKAHLTEDSADEFEHNDDFSPTSFTKTSAYSIDHHPHSASLEASPAIVFDQHLRLAIEKPPDGFDTHALWRLHIPSDLLS